MRKPLALCGIALLLVTSVIRGAQKPNSEAEALRIRRELPGTWDCVMQDDVAAQISHIKHVTPTHYTWVTYDRQRNAILAVSGGTWSLQDGKYQEACEFASASHEHLRGKTFQFKIDLVRDKWSIQGVPGTEIEVEEIWKRVKPRENQAKKP